MPIPTRIYSSFTEYRAISGLGGEGRGRAVGIEHEAVGPMCPEFPALEVLEIFRTYTNFGAPVMKYSFLSSIDRPPARLLASRAPPPPPPATAPRDRGWRPPGGSRRRRTSSWTGWTSLAVPSGSC